MNNISGLEVSGLSCRRGDRLLFSDLNFNVAEGEMLEICGSNGSGKTTLLRLLCGLRQADDGRILWQNADIRQDSENYRRAFCYLGHLNGLKTDLSPYENLRAEQALFANNDTSVDKALGQLGLENEADIPCGRLSAGQKQRSALARLLLRSANLWILDEPLANLDRQAQSQVQNILQNHALDGGTVIFTTHQPIAFNEARVNQLWLGEQGEGDV